VLTAVPSSSMNGGVCVCAGCVSTLGLCVFVCSVCGVLLIRLQQRLGWAAGPNCCEHSGELFLLCLAKACAMRAVVVLLLCHMPAVLTGLGVLSMHSVYSGAQ
jgi:hypothetical protein